MGFLRKILDNIKPHFKEGKLKKLYPAYDAFEPFLFVPNHTSDTSCHVRDSVDLKRTMGTVILALVPCLLFGCYNIGYQHFSQLGGELPSIFSLFTFGLSLSGLFSSLGSFASAEIPVIIAKPYLLAYVRPPPTSWLF